VERQARTVGIGGGWGLALLGLNRVLHDQELGEATWTAQEGHCGGRFNEMVQDRMQSQA
jgi:hypothetical protein